MEHSPEELIGNFQFQRILKNDPKEKTLVLLGLIDNKDAIVFLEKSHFNVDQGSFKVGDIIKEIRLINNNDVYFWSSALIEHSLPEAPSGKVNIIYPATETHIKKYEEQRVHYITETPEMYATYVKPYIESMKGDRIKWVYNILFHGKESETFVYHDKDPDNGFVLLPDMKWDKVNMDSLYLCCIVNRCDISSIRDLNSSHVSFLENLKKKIITITCTTYSIKADELRVFVHYQPSYYHFHIHVVNLMHQGLGNGIAAGRAILLDDVIENLRLVLDYYQVRNLNYFLGENHGLWAIEGFREANVKSNLSN